MIANFVSTSPLSTPASLVQQLTVSEVEREIYDVPRVRHRNTNSSPFRLRPDSMILGQLQIRRVYVGRVSHDRRARLSMLQCRACRLRKHLRA